MLKSIILADCYGNMTGKTLQQQKSNMKICRACTFHIFNHIHEKFYSKDALCTVRTDKTIKR